MRQIDFEHGGIAQNILKAALPMLVAQVLNLLYNIVDRIYIGHMPEVGASALTGVGLFTPILMLITAFAMLCGSGGAPRAAIAWAAAMTMPPKDHGQLLYAAADSGGCADRCVLFRRAVPAGAVRCQRKTLPYALDYARIYIIGTILCSSVMGL